jgi:hypothetical protein
MAKLATWVWLLALIFASEAHSDSLAKTNGKSAPQTNAVQLEYFSETTIPHKLKFQNTIIGGLSGLYYQNGILTAVSDDRGKVNEPRFYEFSVKLDAKEFKVEPTAVHIIFNGTLAHGSKAKSNLPFKVLDLEAIAPLPWGSWLLASEGDNNQKPRVPPVLIDIKPDGNWSRYFEFPEKFIAEPVGLQKKGIRNNKGPEGLTVDPSGKRFLVGFEQPLVQGDQSFSSFIEYNASDAWTIKPGKEYFYPKVTDGIAENGVSEILFIDDHRVLVLERCLTGLSKGQIELGIKIFLTDLKLADAEGKLKKVLVLDLEQIKTKLKTPSKIENYEGMTWGPQVDGKRTLILVSDDNFMRNQRTHFLALKFIE